MKALINANIYDYHSFKPNSYLLFDEVIREVGEMGGFDPAKATEVFDCRNALLLPGLIMGHSHIYSALVRGINLPFRPSSFREILDQLWWRFDRGIDLEATYHSAMVSGLEHLKVRRHHDDRPPRQRFGHPRDIDAAQTGDLRRTGPAGRVLLRDQRPLCRGRLYRREPGFREGTKPPPIAPGFSACMPPFR